MAGEEYFHSQFLGIQNMWKTIECGGTWKAKWQDSEG